MREFFLTASSRLGLHLLFRLFGRSRLTILLYHGVAPSIPQGIYNYRKKFIDPLVFAKQMEYLRRKYTILPLEEALERLADGTLPPYSLAVTFDDGYKNNFTYAFPVLRAHSIPATIYLTTDFVDEGRPLWVDRLEHAIGLSPYGNETPLEEKKSSDALLRSKLKTLDGTKRDHRLAELEHAAGVTLKDFSGTGAVYAPLSWEECKMMRQWRIAFGAHTCTHPILSRLTASEQTGEINDSRAIVSERVGSISRIFAYPNGQPGDWNEDSIDVLRRAGFTGSLTTVPGKNGRSTPPFALHRISMDDTEDGRVFLLKVTGTWSFFAKFKGLVAPKK